MTLSSSIAAHAANVLPCRIHADRAAWFVVWLHSPEKLYRFTQPTRMDFICEYWPCSEWDDIDILSIESDSISCVRRMSHFSRSADTWPVPDPHIRSEINHNLRKNNMHCSGRGHVSLSADNRIRLASVHVSLPSSTHHSAISRYYCLRHCRRTRTAQLNS